VLIEASWAMRLLSEDLKIRREVANGGAIAALVQLVSDTSKGASSNQRILERVAWALRNFTKQGSQDEPSVLEENFTNRHPERADSFGMLECFITAKLSRSCVRAAVPRAAL
jgi:hypothetical protein